MAVEVAAIVAKMQDAGRNWEAALDAHAFAPPDAGFALRIQNLSDAAYDQAAAFDLAAEGGLGWRSRTIEGEFYLAPELMPGMNRPGPPELWEDFDRAVAGLATALAGSSPSALASAFRELADVANALATDLRRHYRAARTG